jgi:hypothetical protein
VRGAGKRATTSFLKAASDFPLVDMKASISYGTFFRSVEKEMKVILLFDIWRIELVYLASEFHIFASKNTANPMIYLSRPIKP